MYSEGIELAPSKPRIMLVEDNPLVMDVLKNLLSAENYEVYASENGKDALTSLNTLDADLIICDVMMPEMDGFAFQEKLRENTDLARIPFVFLTALGDQESIVRGKSVGADAYIVKPFDPNELLATVRGKIQRSKELRRYYEQQQDQFSAQIIRHISHEFRTPLVAVTTGSELLLSQQQNLAQDKLSTLVSTIWRGGQRLEKLINNFILLQQVQSGQAQRAFSEQQVNIDIAEHLMAYLASNKKAYLEQQVQVNFESQLTDSTILRLHAGQLNLILDRLIENSIKFSHEPKQVIIRLIPDGRFVRIAIQDNGQGFDEQAFKNITRIFYQHRRDVQEQQGGGLGLVICKFLTRINRGRIKFSNNQAGGAEVNLFFPI